MCSSDLVDGRKVKIRAARLRAAGQSQVKRHLSAQLGKRHTILMESPTMGRTEQFTEVRFATPHTEGEIVSAVITGHDDTRLTAE